MKTNYILQKYLFKELLNTFLPVSGFFIIIFALTEFFWRLPDFITFKPRAFIVIKYLLLHIPLWFIQTLPMTTMLSILLILLHFIYTKEIAAIKTLGIDLKKFFISWLIFGLLLSLTSFYVNDRIATIFFKKAQNIFKTEVKKEPLQENVFHNLTYSDTKNVFATIDSYDKNNFLIYNIIIEQLDSEYNLITQIYATKGTKKNNDWILNNAIIRNYKNNILLSEQKIVELKLPLEIDVEDFQYDYSNQPLDQLSVKELKNIINITKLRGLPTEKYLTELGFRFALPAINFILILLSISLGQITSIHYGKLISFVYTISSIIIYWTLLSIFRNFGEFGIINPFISVWIPNFIFLFFGILLYFRKKQ